MHYVIRMVARFSIAVRKWRIVRQILKRNNLRGSDIDVFIPHQANQRIYLLPRPTG